MKRLCLFAFALAGSSAFGQVEPTLDANDPRFGTVVPIPNQNIQLRMHPGGLLNLLFTPGERVEAVSVSDIGGFQVTVPPLSDNLVVRALRPGATSMMSVRTNLRGYDFMLTTALGATAPYIVQVRSDAPSPGRSEEVSSPQPTFAEPGRYRVSGSRELRPTAISDDGLRTFIQWAPSQAIPAVFALDRLGREEMVNGFMRGGSFTIDRVHERLIFRIDNAKASATRIVERRGTS